MTEDNLDSLTGILAVVGFYVSAVVLSGLFLRWRASRQKMEHTERMAVIEKGHEISSDLLGWLGAREWGRDHDLRDALLWMAAGVGYIFAVALLEGGARLFVGWALPLRHWTRFSGLHPSSAPEGSHDPWLRVQAGRKAGARV